MPNLIYNPLSLFPYDILYQSNRVSKSYFNRDNDSILTNISIYHIRILYEIIRNLQPFIKNEINNPQENLIQSELFQTNSSYIAPIEIDYKTIAPRSKYDEVTQALQDFAKLSISFPSLTNEGYQTFQSFISKYEIPTTSTKRTFIIHLDKDVARYLIHLDKTPDRKKAIQYTKYQYSVIMSKNSIYTIKMYILLCAWKQAKSFYISYNDLRQQLSVQDDKYKVYPNFKKKILKKTFEDLKELGEIWFDIDAPNFEVREFNHADNRSNQIVGFNFNIITSNSIEAEHPKLNLEEFCNNTLLPLLAKYLGFDALQLSEIGSMVLSIRNATFQYVSDRLIDMLQNVIKDVEQKKISDPFKYFKQSIINAFFAEEKMKKNI